jgi:hypothetical protein
MQLLLVTFALLAHAGPPDCSLVDLKSAPVGFKCVADASQPGNKPDIRIVERVKRAGFRSAWKCSDGLTWGFNDEEMAYPEAFKDCQARGMRLPTDAEVFGRQKYRRVFGFPCGVAADYFSTGGGAYWTSDNYIVDPADAPGAAKLLYACRAYDPRNSENHYFGMRRVWSYWMNRQAFACVTGNRDNVL